MTSLRRTTLQLTLRQRWPLRNRAMLLATISTARALETPKGAPSTGESRACEWDVGCFATEERRGPVRRTRSIAAAVSPRKRETAAMGVPAFTGILAGRKERRAHLGAARAYPVKPLAEVNKSHFNTFA